MKIKNLTLIEKLKKEIYEYFISSLDKTPFVKSNITYGSFKFSIDAKNENDIPEGNVNVIDANRNWHTAFEVKIKKHNFGWFGSKKTLDNYLENELYRVFVKHYEAQKRATDLIKYKSILNSLPEDRKQQIIREQKLGRIVNEDE